MEGVVGVEEEGAGGEGKKTRRNGMNVLDCETADSTYHSLEEILGVTRPRLDALFDDFDIDKACEHEPDRSPDQLLFRLSWKWRKRSPV